MTPDAIARALRALERAEGIAARKPETMKGVRVYLGEALRALREAARET